MKTIIAGVVVATVWQVAPVYVTPVVVTVLGLLIIDAILTGSPALVREPKQPGTHRWALGLGLGLTFMGPIPFITIYRRPR